MKITYSQAINKALEEEMKRNKNLVCFGLGANDSMKFFGTTKGLKEKFGEDVVIKKFEKAKGWLSQKLSSSNHVDQFANILDERSIWQRYGF